jgi:5,10-methylenetetrahydromethanopterin reductase
MNERVALYLQDAHDLRDGLNYARYAEQHGLKLSGKQNPGW